MIYFYFRKKAYAMGVYTHEYVSSTADTGNIGVVTNKGFIMFLQEAAAQASTSVRIWSGKHNGNWSWMASAALET